MSMSGPDFTFTLLKMAIENGNPEIVNRYIGLIGGQEVARHFFLGRDVMPRDAAAARPLAAETALPDAPAAAADAAAARPLAAETALPDAPAAAAVVVEPPESFMCPISFVIMTDPVITRTGHTFQREAIVRHLSSHNFDPLDMSLCYIAHLIPNLALRNSVEEWLNAHPDYEHKEGVRRRP